MSQFKRGIGYLLHSPIVTVAEILICSGQDDMKPWITTSSHKCSLAAVVAFGLDSKLVT